MQKTRQATKKERNSLSIKLLLKFFPLWGFVSVQTCLFVYGRHKQTYIESSNSHGTDCNTTLHRLPCTHLLVCTYFLSFVLMPGLVSAPFSLVLSSIAMVLVAVDLASASLEGLYGLSPGDGQMYFINSTSGEETPVGSSLKSKGFSVDECTPTDLDTTGKWMYTLGRNISQGASAPLVLLAMQLVDAELHPARYSLPQVAGFNPNATACEHTIVAGYGWMAYVTASVNDRIRTFGFMCDHSFWKACELIPGASTPVLVVNEPFAQFDLGGLPTVASSALDDTNRMWVQMERGAVGIPMKLRNRTTVDRVATAPDGKTFTGFQRGFGSGRIYGVLASSADPSESVVGYIETGGGWGGVAWFP